MTRVIELLTWKMYRVNVLLRELGCDTVPEWCSMSITIKNLVACQHAVYAHTCTVTQAHRNKRGECTEGTASSHVEVHLMTLMQVCFWYDHNTDPHKPQPKIIIRSQFHQTVWSWVQKFGMIKKIHAHVTIHTQRQDCAASIKFLHSTQSDVGVVCHGYLWLQSLAH